MYSICYYYYSVYITLFNFIHSFIHLILIFILFLGIFPDFPMRDFYIETDTEQLLVK